MAKSGIPLEQWSGADATDRLHGTIRADSRWTKVGTVAAVIAAVFAVAAFLVQVL